MEPKSDLRAVQPETWRNYLPDRPGQHAWRNGQQRTWDIVASRGDGGTVFANLPTGYGKTITICGAYAIQRARGVVSRLLVIVPTDQLREQMAPSRGASAGLADDFARVGYQPRGVVAVSKSPRDLRYAREGIADVFVATYAQVISDPVFWSTFMRDGSWFVAFDEAHHLSESNTWGACVQRLRAAFRLFLSATPIRQDKQGIIGLETVVLSDGTREHKPDVVVTIEEASNEGALRPLIADVHDYFVDVLLPGDDVPRRITTADLRAEGVVSFSEYQAKSQLRYASKYLSTMLHEACDEWRRREMDHPGQNQILVFAMTNAHARVVTEQLRATAPDVRTDWIGQDRTADDNRAVLERFNARGANGVATGSLDCLVQVDKASEGFDNPRCSVLVFLHLVGSPPKLMQQIGRGLRRNYAIPLSEDSASIFASKDTEIAALAMDLDAAMRANLPPDVEPDATQREQGSRLLPDYSVEIAGVELRGVETISAGVTLDRAMIDLGATVLARVGIDASGLSPAQLAALGAELRQPTMSSTAPEVAAPAKLSETAALEQWRQRVTRAASTIAGDVVRGRHGAVIEKSLIGDLVRSLHAQWKRTTGRGHDAMTSADLRAKYEWLRSIQAQVQRGEVPLWLAK